MTEGGTQDTTYTMTVDLSVLESLGINLYSNAAAVLSELVANSYDADAFKVQIDWKKDGNQVVVSDDGVGMTVAELNDRFLTAGYKKRVHEGSSSPLHQRPFMGRKGIGKLSVFSIAKTVEVYSRVHGGETNGFRIVVDHLEEAIRERRAYHPEPTAVPAQHEIAVEGTTIVMSSLKSKRADLTAAALRKRLARRFDVLDERTPEQGGFQIWVNQTRVTWMDRQELKKLEFLWEFGSQTLPDRVLPPGVTRFVLPSAVVDAGRGWRVGGWFGTARKPTDLTDDDDAGSLKNIIVLARKRPIQEGIIEKLDFSRIFGNYVTGQVEADFLDLDDEEFDDIATSDRQRLIEDDERVVKLQEFLRAAFVTAADQWSKARPKKEAVDVLARYPAIKQWVDARPGWQRDAAERMIGTVASLELERSNEAEDRRTLFRSGILAFERVGLRQAADDLQTLSSVQAADLLPLLGRQDEYEAGLWVDILRSRIRAIEQFRGLTDTDEKEKVLQQHLFDHLWLLDPAWERATDSATMEENLRRIDPDLLPIDNAGNEITGRMDVRYKTVGGRHVIVELKRYTVKAEALDLREQGAKYAEALASVLRSQQRDEEVSKIEVVFVLGKRPGTKGSALSPAEEYYADLFKSINGRYVLYDALINNARSQYLEYLEASDKSRALDALLGTLDEIEVS